MAGHAEFFTDAEGFHRFRVKAGNSEIVTTSEGYRDRSDAERGLATLIGIMADVKVNVRESTSAEPPSIGKVEEGEEYPSLDEQTGSGDE